MSEEKPKITLEQATLNAALRQRDEALNKCVALEARLEIATSEMIAWKTIAEKNSKDDEAEYVIRDETPVMTVDQKRAEAYPVIGDQLDVLWKQFNQLRLDGQPLIQEADDMLGAILAVKANHPKE